MQAIILAAGMGKRLKALTQSNTKCMVKVNGVTLIDRMLHQLENLHLSRIVIVVGYEGKKLIDYIATLKIQTPIIYVNNAIYDKTNNIYSLFLARDYLRQEDTILLESDLIFDDSLLDELLNDPRDTLALVDKFESWMDGTCFEISEDDTIKNFIPKKNFKFDHSQKYFKTVNIYKFSKNFSETRYIPFLEAYSRALGNNEYYESVLRVIMILDDPGIKAKRLNSKNRRWYEIDDVQDLNIAESIFAPTADERLERIQRRYGGYWRYPGLLDFCYLVNPFFPTKRMLDEIKASLDDLLTEYPSGMNVNSLLAEKNFGVKKENLVVGNGAAELIKSLMSLIDGTIGMIRPTFEEYPHRYDSNKIVEFTITNENFSYNVDDIKSFFDDKNISNLLLINPDNPSGNYIEHEDVIELLSWCREKNIRLILDESFIDFADESDSLIDQKILEDNHNLFVMKSISKSYGVPGLRLGILASGNADMIDKIKKDVPIWNINSLAEFFMQIFEKYRGDYKKSLQLLQAERDRFMSELKTIPTIRVIPSRSNFLMVESLKISSTDLTKILLTEENIFVKDLSVKTHGSHLRLSIRNPLENDRLIDALKKNIVKGILKWEKFL